MVLHADDGLEYFLGIDLGGYDPRWTLLGVVLPGEPDTTRVRLPVPRPARSSPSRLPPDLPARRLTLDLHRGFVCGRGRPRRLGGDPVVAPAGALPPSARHRRLPAPARCASRAASASWSWSTERCVSTAAWRGPRSTHGAAVAVRRSSSGPPPVPPREGGPLPAPRCTRSALPYLNRTRSRFSSITRIPRTKS